MTQHLETILPALYKCSRDDEKKIVEEVCVCSFFSFFGVSVSP